MGQHDSQEDGQVVAGAQVIAAFAARWGRAPSRAELAASRWVPGRGRLDARELVEAMGPPPG